MRAVIMAGGFGTRLRPLTSLLPKPMVPIANKPMMEHVVALLRGHGFTDVVTLVYCQPEIITSYFGDGSRFGVRMRYARPEGDLGTAGAVRFAHAAGLLDGRTLVVSGDVLTDIDLSSAVGFHEERKAEATIVLTRVSNPLAFGVVIADASGRIERFLEKPSWGQVFSDTVNTGIYVLEDAALLRVPAEREFDFSKDLFPAMLADGAALYGTIAGGYWRDVGNAAEYAAAHRDVLRGEVGLQLPENVCVFPDGKAYLDLGANIGSDAVVRGVVCLGRDARVSGRAVLEDSVIGAGCAIADGATVARSIVWENARVGRGAHVTEAILCSDASVGDRAVVEENAIIAAGARVGNSATVRGGLKVWPGKTVEDGAVLTESLVWGERWRSELFTDAKVSGLANVELTPEFAARLGAAFGAVLGAGATVLAGRDPSAVARMTHRAVAAGLMSTGVNVQDLQELPIPVVRFRLASGAAQGGVHVRHDPTDPARIDVVFFAADGKDLGTARAKDIERLVAREDFRRAPYEKAGAIAFPQRVAEAYREALIAAVDAETIRRRAFRVAVDYASGGAVSILPSILGELGCRTVALNAYVESRPPHRSESDVRAAVAEMRTMVRSFHADAGFVLDPGAECIVAVTDRGSVLQGQDFLVSTLALALSHGGVKKVGVPVAATRLVERMAEGRAEVVRVRNDHLGMMAAAAGGADVVIGTRGGIIVRSFAPGVDATFGLAYLLQLLAADGRPFDAVWKGCPRPRVVRALVPCPWARVGQVMRSLMEHTAKRERQLIDGVRFADGSTTVTILPDRKEAAFNVVAEDESLVAARVKMREYATLVRRLRDGRRRK